MNIIFFKHTSPRGSIYTLKNTHNLLQNLAIFLREEVDCFGSFRLMRLINALNDGDETSGNLMTVEKRGNDLYISNIHYKGPDDKQKYFIISKHELEKLMKQWEQLMKKLPDKVILSEQNGKFELVGKDYSKNAMYEKIKNR